MSDGEILENGIRCQIGRHGGGGGSGGGDGYGGDSYGGDVARGRQIPDSNISLSLFACLCCNGLCLGTAAFLFSLASIFALPSRTRGAAPLTEQNLQLSARRAKWAWRLSLISILVNVIFFVVYTVLQGLGDNDVYWPPLPFKSHHGAGLEGDGRGGGGRGGDVSNVVNELTLTTFNGTA